MPYLDLPLPESGGESLSVGDEVTINAFTNRASTHEIVVLRPSSPSIYGTLTIEVPGGTDIPAGAMIQTPFLTWASRMAFHVPEEEEGSMPKPVTLPGALIPTVSPQPGFGIDWDDVRQTAESIIIQGSSTVAYELGEMILERVLRPITEVFVGRRANEHTRKQIKSAWDQSIKLMKQSDLIPRWHWEQMEEKLLTTADQIIRRMVEELPIVQPPPKKQKIERPDAPWRLDD